MNTDGGSHWANLKPSEGIVRQTKKRVASRKSRPGRSELRKTVSNAHIMEDGATDTGGWARAPQWVPRDLVNNENVFVHLTQRTWKGLGSVR